MQYRNEAQVRLKLNKAGIAGGAGDDNFLVHHSEIVVTERKTRPRMGDGSDMRTDTDIYVRGGGCDCCTLSRVRLTCVVCVCSPSGRLFLVRMVGARKVKHKNNSPNASVKCTSVPAVAW